MALSRLFVVAVVGVLAVGSSLAPSLLLSSLEFRYV
jgi:hypothetical protein